MSLDSLQVLNIEAQDTFAVLLPVFTAIIASLATLLGVWLSNRSSENRLRIQLNNELAQKRADKHSARLEELYVMIGKDAKSVSNFYAHYLPVASGQVDLSWARKKSVEEGFKSAPDQERLEMMFYLYYPDMIADFESFKSVVQLVWGKWSPCEKAIENGQTPTQEQKNAFAQAWLQIDIQAKELKKIVASRAQSENS